MDMLGQYATNRFNNAVSNLGTQYDNAAQFLTDPQAAMQRRLDEEEEERRRREALAAQARGETPTPVKQTITTDPITGEQKMKIEGSVQDLSAANPMTPTVTGPAVPGMMDQTGPTQDEIMRDQAMAQLGGLTPVAPTQMPAQAQPQPQPQPEPEPQPVVTQPQPQPAAVAQPQPQPQPQPAVAQPQPAPAAVAQPQAAVQPVMPDQTGPSQDEIRRDQAMAQVMGQTPTPQPQAIQPRIAFGEPIPEPPTQVAQAGTGTRTDVTAGTTGAVPPAAGDFSDRFRGIMNNPRELARIIATSDNPAEQKIAAQLMRLSDKETQERENAEDTTSKALQGDPKAQTQLQKDLRKEDGSYIKAYMFRRLGFNKLADEEEDKLGTGKKTISSIQLDGKQYSAVVDNKGMIVQAYDDSGDRVDTKTVAKLQAGGQKTTTQAYGFTGGSLIIPAGQPDAGQEYRQRTNSTTGKIENIITSGPRSGQIYTGPAGMERRVSTQAQVDYNSALIKFRTAPNTAAATEALKFAVDAYGVGSPEVQQAQQEINNRLGPAALPQIMQGVPALQQSAAGGGQSAAGSGQAAAGGGQAAAGDKPRPGESAASFRKRMAVAEARDTARGQVVGKEEGITDAQQVKNQRTVDSAYSLIVPINNAIKEATGSYIGAGADEVARLFGISTKGSQATARLNVLSQKILADIPRFEGPQSDNDVNLYRQAAGDLNNRTLPIGDRLAALETIVSLLKKYDTAGKHDFTFGGQASGGQTSTGVKFREVR